MFPDETKVQELVSVLKEKKIGVVAHFYMDPEVQGVLTAAQKHWPHIHISDSLVMADKAVNMAKAGCEFITVLGVDFMSENVRAILDQAGFGKVYKSLVMALRLIDFFFLLDVNDDNLFLFHMFSTRLLVHKSIHWNKILGSG